MSDKLTTEDFVYGMQSYDMEYALTGHFGRACLAQLKDKELRKAALEAHDAIKRLKALIPEE